MIILTQYFPDSWFVYLKWQLWITVCLPATSHMHNGIAHGVTTTQPQPLELSKKDSFLAIYFLDSLSGLIGDCLVQDLSNGDNSQQVSSFAVSKCFRTRSEDDYISCDHTYRERVSVSAITSFWTVQAPTEMRRRRSRDGGTANSITDRPAFFPPLQSLEQVPLTKLNPLPQMPSEQFPAGPDLRRCLHIIL